MESEPACPMKSPLASQDLAWSHTGFMLCLAHSAIMMAGYVPLAPLGAVS